MQNANISMELLIVTGLVSSVVLIVVLLVVGPYFKTLPNCVLASIVIVALKGMFMQFSDLKVLWNISSIDFAVWLVAFTATVLLDVVFGLLVGVGFALLTVIMRSQRPYSCLLGQVPGTDIYKDMNVYKTAEEIPNIKIFRFDSALFFANAEFFRSSLYKMTVDPKELKKKQRKLDKIKIKEEKQLNKIENPVADNTLRPNTEDTSDLMASAGFHSELTQIKPTPSMAGETAVDSTENRALPSLTDVYVIILDCSTMSYVDSMGVKVLQQIILELRAFNVTVYLAQCKSSVREMFECTNFYKTGSKQYLFVTVHDAVITAQMQQCLRMEESKKPAEGDDIPRTSEL